jgi:hypothetical protein
LTLIVSIRFTFFGEMSIAEGWQSVGSEKARLLDLLTEQLAFNMERNE